MSNSLSEIQAATAQAAATQTTAQPSSAAETFASVLAGLGGFAILPGQLNLAMPGGTASEPPQRLPLRDDEQRDPAENAWDRKDAVRDRTAPDRPDTTDRGLASDDQAAGDDDDPTSNVPAQPVYRAPAPDDDGTGLESIGVVGPTQNETAPTIRIGQDTATAGLLGSARTSIRPDAAQLQNAGDASPTDDAIAPLVTRAKNAQGGKDGAIKITVDDASTTLTSRPNASLAAAATVTAQAGQAARAGTAQTNLLDGQGSSETDAPSGQKDTPLSFTQNRAGNQSSTNGSMTQAGSQQNGQTADQAPAPVAASFSQAMAARSAAAGQSQLSGVQSTTTASGEPSLTTTGAGGQVQTSQRPAGHASAVRTRPAAPHQPIADQIAVSIKRAIGTGTDRINIQLRPQELGRVDIKMEVASDGRVLAVVSVDRPDTLELLQRDQRALQDALNQAGLNADNDSFSFNLKGENGDSQDGQGDDRHADRPGDVDEDELGGPDGAHSHIDIIRADRIDVVL